MGCDIHGFIEYDSTNPDFPHTFNFAQVRLERNYWMFALLATVRGESVQGHAGHQPKGVPPGMSSTLRDEYYLKLVDDDDDPLIETGMGYISKSRAEKQKYKKIDDYHCENTDYHTISYMNLDELDEVLTAYMKLKETLHVVVPKSESLIFGDEIVQENEANRLIKRTSHVTMPADYAAVRAILASMRENGIEARFVFYFDN